MPEFPCSGPITASITIPGGLVEVTAEERSSAEVTVTPYDDRSASREMADQTRVDFHGDKLTVEAPSSGGFRRGNARIRVVARIPVDSRLSVRIASATVTCRGRYAEVSCDGASGDVTIEQVTGDVSIRTASGDVQIDRVDGRLDATGASGDIKVGRAAGTTKVSLASGDLMVERADGDLNAKTASGDVEIAAAGSGAVRVSSASGDVSVGVPAGTAVWVDLKTLSGTTRSDLAIGDDPPAGGGQQLSIEVKTASGDIAVRRVAAPA